MVGDLVLCLGLGCLWDLGLRAGDLCLGLGIKLGRKGVVCVEVWGLS
jgi:hypothetical protein